MRYPSHHNIYKLYFHFNCSKFVVGEIDLPTYLPTYLLTYLPRHSNTLEQLEREHTGVNHVKLERWYKSFPTNPVELHISVDVSEKAYGAVAYIKTINNGIVSCNFLLAPISKLSLTILSVN